MKTYPLKSVIFANPVKVHKNLAAQSSMVWGPQVHNRNIDCEVTYLPELQVVHCRQRDRIRDAGDWTSRAVNFANVISFEFKSQPEDLLQSKRSKATRTPTTTQSPKTEAVEKTSTK